MVFRSLAGIILANPKLVGSSVWKTLFNDSFYAGSNDSLETSVIVTVVCCYFYADERIALAEMPRFKMHTSVFMRLLTGATSL